MTGELMTTLTSLGGVALGGGLSYLVQNNTQRMSARTEQRKQDVTRTESHGPNASRTWSGSLRPPPTRNA
jgi:hypothetical protein